MLKVHNCMFHCRCQGLRKLCDCASLSWSTKFCKYLWSVERTWMWLCSTLWPKDVDRAHHREDHEYLAHYFVLVRLSSGLHYIHMELPSYAVNTWPLKTGNIPFWLHTRVFQYENVQKAYRFNSNPIQKHLSVLSSMTWEAPEADQVTCCDGT